MTLDSGWAAALSSIVSAVVVAVTAVAAFAQLRQYRAANELVLFLRLVDIMDSPEVTAARRALPAEAARHRAEPEYLARFADPLHLPEQTYALGLMLRSLEHLSLLVIKGGLAEDLVLAEYADTFVAIWDEVRPLVVQRRIAYGPHTGRAFEHIAMRSRRYIESGAMDREYARLLRDERP